MQWNNHSSLDGQHAFLSPSNYHWLGYTTEKLVAVYRKHAATVRGTKMHAVAKECIELGISVFGDTAFARYVEDGIKFQMSPEVLLYYSDNAFGTADAISFENNILRIHDLKTGETKTNLKQLLVYSALFYLEYDENPEDCVTYLRIYQDSGDQKMTADPNDILKVMETIVTFDSIIEETKRGE